MMSNFVYFYSDAPKSVFFSFCIVFGNYCFSSFSLKYIEIACSIVPWPRLFEVRYFRSFACSLRGYVRSTRKKISIVAVGSCVFGWKRKSAYAIQRFKYWKNLKYLKNLDTAYNKLQFCTLLPSCGLQYTHQLWLAQYKIGWQSNITSFTPARLFTPHICVHFWHSLSRILITKLSSHNDNGCSFEWRIAWLTINPPLNSTDRNVNVVFLSHLLPSSSTCPLALHGARIYQSIRCGQATMTVGDSLFYYSLSSVETRGGARLYPGTFSDSSHALLPTHICLQKSH